MARYPVGSCFFHDNTRTHTAGHIVKLLQKFDYEIFENETGSFTFESDYLLRMMTKWSLPLIIGFKKNIW